MGGNDGHYVLYEELYNQWVNDSWTGKISYKLEGDECTYVIDGAKAKAEWLKEEEERKAKEAMGE